MAGQIQLDFGGGTDEGFANWQRELRERREAIAAKLGLPVGERAEVELNCGQILRGRLRLRNDHGSKTSLRNSALEIDGVPFHLHEVVACRKAD